MLILHGCVCASCPPDVEHSRTQRPQHSPPPALGPLPWCGLKTISARKGWCFQWREVWEASSAHNLAMLPVGCQFKNSSAKRGCALLGNPKVSSASIQSCASMDNSTSGASARRSNGDLGGGVHLCLMDMTAFRASHGPVLEAGAGRRNALDRRATLASRATG